MTIIMNLKSKLLDTQRGLYLYSTTPPRLGTSTKKLNALAKKLATRLSELNLDAI